MAASDSTPQQNKQRPAKAPRASQPRGVSPAAWALLMLLLLSVLLFSRELGGGREVIDYSFFLEQVAADNVSEVEFEGQTAYGEFRNPPLKSSPEQEDASPDDKPAAPTDTKPSVAEEADRPRWSKEFSVTLPPFADDRLLPLLDAHHVAYKAEQPFDFGQLVALVWLGLLLALLIGMWVFARRARDQIGGGMLTGVLKSPARRYDVEGPKVTFDDVAGLRGVKSDLKEIVDYLREPEKFQRLGAQIPKGVLLMGPPGTGKTLLAKAVAGEAGVPFYSISGSEFIQLFVGVGASRVRDMFKNAKKHAPAILFIDEIDAIGRQRGAGLGGGHDEREQTLNQILSEMDGFTPTTSVIVIAATNRPDVLDPALLRPGRFDRHVMVDRPSIEGRRELFEVHSRNIPVTEDVDFDRLARATVGLTGADIRNLVNEAALWATRRGKDKVDMDDFEHARDKILMGAARDEVLTPQEKRITAFHEAGHAIIAWILPHLERLHKVTIIPRGRALGVTQLLPDEDRYNLGQQEMHARLAMFLAGRAAEKLEFDEFSAGAENDLKEATRLARRMVTHWGMSDRLGPVAYTTAEEHPFLGREIVQEHRQFSEHTAQVIDEEVAKILHQAADRAKRTLVEHRDKLDKLAEALLEHEELDEQEVQDLIGPSLRSAGEPAATLESSDDRRPLPTAVRQTEQG